MEVRAVFLQGSLLKALCVFYCTVQQKIMIFIMSDNDSKLWIKYIYYTFLSSFAYYFNVLHGDF